MHPNIYSGPQNRNQEGIHVVETPNLAWSKVISGSSGFARLEVRVVLRFSLHQWVGTLTLPFWGLSTQKVGKLSPLRISNLKCVCHMSYSLNSLKGGYIGDCMGIIKGDTRSLDYSSHETLRPRLTLSRASRQRQQDEVSASDGIFSK